jgi:hypothetical protein
MGVRIGRFLGYAFFRAIGVPFVVDEFATAIASNSMGVASSLCIDFLAKLLQDGWYITLLVKEVDFSKPRVVVDDWHDAGGFPKRKSRGWKVEIGVDEVVRLSRS